MEVTRTDKDRPRSALEAYERAYDNNGSRRTKTNDVSKILAKSHIKDAIEEAEAKIEADRRRASRGTAQAIQTALWNEVHSPEARSSDRISALKALVTLLPKGALEEKPLDDSVSSKHELVERLQELLEGNLDDVIDITPDDGEIEDGDIMEAEILEIQAELKSTKSDY